MDGYRDRYAPHHDHPKPKEPNADTKSFQIEDMLAPILNKVEGSYKVLKEMKGDISSLNQSVTSHSILTKQLETQMDQISGHFNLKLKGGLPSDTVANSKNDNAQSMDIMTRRDKVVESDVPNDNNASSSTEKAIIF
ncbi:hypothetical protein MTR67_052242 [Solanum verrucosum]|uniref:Integrase core domain containing protein n=1 Tax=Solanum verrucosum TaxID=315347 RepID=A0AAF0V6J8_SOLVR|nr:hypothetical protein MTR67_052242 [Solanum verrucosum]